MIDPVVCWFPGCDRPVPPAPPTGGRRPTVCGQLVDGVTHTRTVKKRWIDAGRTTGGADDTAPPVRLEAVLARADDALRELRELLATARTEAAGAAVRERAAERRAEIAEAALVRLTAEVAALRQDRESAASPPAPQPPQAR